MSSSKPSGVSLREDADGREKLEKANFDLKMKVSECVGSFQATKKGVTECIRTPSVISAPLFL